MHSDVSKVIPGWVDKSETGKEEKPVQKSVIKLVTSVSSYTGF